ncbi:MAG: TonB-dependent receptor [Flavobacterium sp.]|nr:TonB-dependent receptor [Flavobacterium sp.]
MQKIVLPILYLGLFFVTQLGFGQEKRIVSGRITDSKSNESLIGVSIFDEVTKKGTQTNEYGFYSLTLNAGSHRLRFNSMGYKPEVLVFELAQDKTLNVALSPALEELEEVVIKDNKKASNIRKAEMSVNKLTVATIKSMPVVLGEVDVLKSILLLPGVTNAGEGSSGFNVRGGGADQNLLILDEATLYNSSHVFGFFSVFNPDAIKDLKLYKGGIPARFGGRASSVLDIYQKDGNSKKFHLNGGIGLITSRLLAEGPIVKDKGSFLLAGRGSYAHLFLKFSEDQKDNAAYFYDLNTKLHFQLDSINHLYASGYFGRDVFRIKNLFENQYGNATFNLRWNHLFSNKMFSNLSLIYSEYYYGLNLDFIQFNWDSGIKNYHFKYDIKHNVSDELQLRYGLSSIYYDFNPGTLRPSAPESAINFRQLEKKKAFEPALYLEAEQQLGAKLNVNYGLRYSLFYRLGTANINTYANNQAVVYNPSIQLYEKASPTGSTYFGANQTIAHYNNWEPRLALAYQLNDNTSVKASYNRMTQYLQLISNTNSPTPLDIWTPSDSFIKPQIADQWAVGYFKNLANTAYSLEVESYYKTVKNRIDYIDGANLIANDAIEQVILNGKMRSYGLEVLFRKNEGKFTGWVAYTLSRSEQQTPGRTAIEPGINQGKWYASVYDKTHNLGITTSYKHSSTWSYSANFALQSGQPVTYPNGQYQYQDITVPVFGFRNQNRLPLYHRLDLSATLVPKSNKGRSWQSEWVFSIYNVYNRFNAASMSFRQNLQTGVNEAVQTAIFGAVPGVSYNLKF